MDRVLSRTSCSDIVQHADLAASQHVITCGNASLRWSGLSLHGWVCLLFVLPSLVLVALTCLATLVPAVDVGDTQSLSNDLASWVGNLSNEVLDEAVSALHSVRYADFTWDICQKQTLASGEAALFFTLSRLGPHQLEMRSLNGDTALVQFNSDKFSVKLKSSNNATSYCYFSTPQQKKVEIFAALSPNQLESVAPTPQRSDVCVVDSANIHCYSQTEECSAWLSVPLSYVSQQLPIATLQSSARVVIFAHAGPGMDRVLASSCGEGRLLPQLNECDMDYVEQFVATAGSLEVPRKSMSLQFVYGSLPMGIVVSVPLADHMISSLHLGILIAAVAICVVFCILALVCTKFQLAKPLEEVTYVCPCLGLQKPCATACSMQLTSFLIVSGLARAAQSPYFGC